MRETSALVAGKLDADWVGVLRAENGDEMRVVAEGGAGAEPPDIDALARLALTATEPVIAGDLPSGSGIAGAIPALARPYGVLAAWSSRPDAFSAADLDFLRSAANVVAEAMQFARGEKEHQRLAVALQAERTRLNALVETIPAGVVLAEAPSGRVLLANRHVTEILRRHRNPATGYALLSPERARHPGGRAYRAEELPLMRSIAHGEVITGEEIDTVLGDGALATLSVSSAPVYDLIGDIVAAVVTFFDVSERKQEDEKARLHRALLAAQGEASTEGILVVSPDGRMISFNRRFVEMWGLPEDVLAAGSDAAALRAVRDKVIDPDGFLARVSHLYDHPDERSSDEVALLDGRIFDRYSAPLAGDDGVHHGRIWFFRDITARKRSEQRQRFLAETASALEEALDVPTVVSTLAEACVPFLADLCEVTLVQPDGTIARMAGRAADGPVLPPGRALEREPIDPDGPHPIAVAIRTGQLLVFDAVPGADALGPKEAELARLAGVVGGVVAPLRARGRTVGALALGHTRTAVRRPDELELVGDLARHAALTIDNVVLYEQQRDVAATLQRSLLPDALPQPPGLALAGRYVPGGQGVEVGGDWYDAVTLPEGGAALVIGDVVGRGLRAATVMGHLRNVSRAHALDGTPPAKAAAAMNRLVQSLSRGDMATMLYVVIDSDLRTLHLSSAGHPPPLIVAPDGGAQYVDGGRSLPFGALPQVAYREATCAVPPGATLLLFTDGLVERRGEGLEVGLARLAEVAAAAAGPEVETFCDRVLDGLLDGELPTDDVALLAVYLTPPDPSALRLRLPADPLSLPSVRHALQRWLADVNAGEQQTFEIVFACNEACANAIEHAYGLEEGRFELEVWGEGDEVVAVVRDFGHWRPPRGQDRGRGLKLMRQMMDEVEVERHARGTEVRMRRRLGGEAAA